VSGYPSLLFDIRSYDFANNLFVCCNCGALPSWYARRSSDPKENMAEVFIEPVIAKYAGGGAHFSSICAAGEITVARLTREGEEYRMFLARGEFVDMPREKLSETCPAWPHGFIRMEIGPKEFINSYHANHAHAVPGNHLRAIEIYCDLMNIKVDKAGG
jgi:L-fucose isomerase